MCSGVCVLCVMCSTVYLGTLGVLRYFKVPPFLGPCRTNVVLLVVLGGTVRGSVLGFGVVVAEQ